MQVTCKKRFLSIEKALNCYEQVYTILQLEHYSDQSFLKTFQIQKPSKRVTAPTEKTIISQPSAVIFQPFSEFLFDKQGTVYWSLKLIDKIQSLPKPEQN